VRRFKRDGGGKNADGSQPPGALGFAVVQMHEKEIDEFRERIEKLQFIGGGWNLGVEAKRGQRNSGGVTRSL